MSSSFPEPPPIKPYTGLPLHHENCGCKKAYGLNEIWKWTGLTGEERAVLSVIARHSRKRPTITRHKGWTHTSDEQIAKELKWSADYVRKIIARLAAKDVLTRKTTPGKPGQGSRYAISKQSCCFK